MSHIHEALKKAQKERDVRHYKYHGIASAAGYRGKSFRSKAAWLATFILILVAFTSYLWLIPKTAQTPGFEGTRSEAALPQTSSESEPAINAAQMYEQARLLQKKGHLREAKYLYEKALKLDPDLVNALNNLGVINISLTDYASAQHNFEKAIGLRPDYVDAYYNLACLHALKGEVSQSLAHLKKAILLDQSVRSWARTDADLENLRGTKEFEELMGLHDSTRISQPCPSQ